MCLCGVFRRKGPSLPIREELAVPVYTTTNGDYRGRVTYPVASDAF